MAVVTAEIRFAPKDAAWVTANAATVFANGEVIYRSTDGKYVLPDGVTALSGLTWYGGVSSSGLIAGTTTITGGTNTRILYNNNGVLGEYDVTGTGTTAVLSISPTFTTDITTPLIYGGSASGGNLTLQSTSNATKGKVLLGTASGYDQVNDRLGVGTQSPSNRFHISSSTAGDGAILGNVYAGIWADSNAYAVFKHTTPASSSGYAMIQQSTGDSFFNGLTVLNMCVAGTARLSITNPDSGSTPHYNFTPRSRSTLTASTNVPILRFTGATQQWATGALATQYFNYFSANTVAFVGASTATDVVNLFVEKNTAGTNATITNNYAIGSNGSIVVMPTTTEALIVNRRSSTANCLTIGADANDNASLSVTNADYIFNISGVERFRVYSGASSGADPAFVFSPFSNTNQTASTEISGYTFSNFQRTWLAGAITTQREAYYKSVTYNFASASTITNSYGLYVEAATAGTNATITNNYAAGFSGNVSTIGRSFINDGSATSLGYDLEVNKSINGGVEGWIRNNTAGSAAFAQWAVRTDGTTQLKMGVLSSAYTTAGLLTAQTGFLMTAGTSINKILIGHQSIAKDIMFINGGTATTDIALGIDATKNVYVGNAALATTATDGFLYVTSCAGPPTGVPTAITGRIPLVADSTNNKLYIYSGGAWVALN